MKKTKFQKIARSNGFPTANRDSYIWKREQNLFSLTTEIFICPKCTVELNNDQTRIPVSEEEEALVPIFCCPKCRKSYVGESGKVYELLRNNAFAKEFTLDKKPLWNASYLEKQAEKHQQKMARVAKLRERLSSIESAVLLLHVHYEDRTMKEYIIVNNPKSESQLDGILHYSSLDARELLTAAFYTERNHKGTLKGKKFTVERPFFPDGPHENLPEMIAPRELSIEEGGGLRSSLVNGRREIVDMLLYSPYTKRYEIIRATHQKDYEYCFTDISLYRKFVREYGNPGVPIFFERSGNGRNDWVQLNTESFLKGYGYSVSQTDGLSDHIRHEILAEVMDLSLLTAEKILGHLDFVSRTHSLPKDELARCKWDEDMKFVENYRVNPTRFLIAK